MKTKSTRTVFQIGMALSILFASEVATADAQSDITSFPIKNQTGEIVCDEDGMAMWSAVATPASGPGLSATVPQQTMEIQVPTHVGNGDSFYTYIGPLLAPSDRIARANSYNGKTPYTERSDIGVQMGVQKYSGGKVTARFFANVAFANGVRNLGSAKAWVQRFKYDKNANGYIADGSSKKFPGLNVSKRWANIAGDGHVNVNEAEFAAGSHLVLTRFLNLVGSTYKETYCIQNNPQIPQAKKQVCVEFDMDSNRFNPNFTPEKTPVGMLRVATNPNRLGSNNDPNCQKLKSANLYWPEQAQILATIPASTRQPDALSSFRDGKRHVFTYDQSQSKASSAPDAIKQSSGGAQ